MTTKNNENERWTVRTQDGPVYGPVDTETFRRWIQEKRVLANDYVWIKEKREWNHASTIPLISDLFGDKTDKDINQNKDGNIASQGKRLLNFLIDQIFLVK